MTIRASALFTNYTDCFVWQKDSVLPSSIQPPAGCELMGELRVRTHERIGSGCVLGTGEVLNITHERFEHWYPALNATDSCVKNITIYDREVTRCDNSAEPALCKLGVDSHSIEELYLTGKLKCDEFSWMSTYYANEWSKEEIDGICQRRLTTFDGDYIKRLTDGHNGCNPGNAKRKCLITK